MAQQINEITKIPSNSEVIKILNQIIKRYNSLGSIYTFKGSVQTYAELLAIENPNVGDVYNVVQEDEEHQIAAGSNFVWDGTVWDNLGGSLAGLVQSVNGINPDSLGNVLLPLIKNVTTNQGVMTFTKNDDTTINVNNVKKLYISTLGENVDLNALTEAGIYICGNDSYAANYENCPIQKAFLLEVQALDNGDFVYQFLTQYNDGSTEAGNQYTRTYYNNNWSAWRTAGSMPTEYLKSISQSGNKITITDENDLQTTIEKILKAVQDENGNNIKDTYATITQLNAKAPLASPTFTGTPKSTTPASSDNSTRIATTAFVKALVGAANNGGIVSANLAQNGYVKFANGFILQWGQNQTRQDQYNTFSFPLSFTTNQVQVVGIGTATYNEWQNGIVITAVTASNFTEHCRSAAQTFRWIAVGH